MKTLLFFILFTLTAGFTQAQWTPQLDQSLGFYTKVKNSEPYLTEGAGGISGLVFYAINSDGDTSKYLVAGKKDGVYTGTLNKDSMLGKAPKTIYGQNVYIMNLEDLIPPSSIPDSLKTNYLSNLDYARQYLTIVVKDSLNEFSGDAKIYMSSEEGVFIQFGETTVAQFIRNGSIDFYRPLNVDKGYGEIMTYGHVGEDFNQYVRLTDDNGVSIGSGYVEVVALSGGSLYLATNEGGDININGSAGIYTTAINNIYFNNGAGDGENSFGMLSADGFEMLTNYQIGLYAGQNGTPSQLRLREAKALLQVGADDDDYTRITMNNTTVNVKAESLNLNDVALKPYQSISRFINTPHDTLKIANGDNRIDALLEFPNNNDTLYINFQGFGDITTEVIDVTVCNLSATRTYYANPWNFAFSNASEIIAIPPRKTLHFILSRANGSDIIPYILSQ